MPNEFNPTTDPAIPIRFPWMSVYTPVVPCTIDGSLSLLEMCAKMLHALNDVITVTNGTQSDMTQLAAYVADQVANMYDIINTHDSTTLADAKAYTDSAITSLRTYVDTQDAATLEAAEQYADEINTNIRTYIAQQLALKQDKLTFDSAPTQGSSNPVTSNGIKRYVDEGLAAKQNTLTFDTTPTDNSTNPVTSAGIKTYVDNSVGSNNSKTYIISQSGNDYVVTDPATNQVITIAELIAYVSRYTTIYLDLVSSGIHTIFTVDSMNSTSGITAITDTRKLTADPAATPHWTLSNRYTNAAQTLNYNAITSHGVKLALQAYDDKLLSNIVVEKDGNSYSSDTTYPTILDLATFETLAPPYVSLYDVDSEERIAVLYYVGKNSSDALFFSNDMIPSSVSTAPTPYTLSINSSGVWTKH